MPRLRRADCSGPGFRRVRRGQGFSYLDEDGDPIERAGGRRAHPRAGHPAGLEGGLDLPVTDGHIQATGIDAAGRKQYLYHPEWRRRRDAEKFDEMLDFAKALPALRERVAADLASGDELTRERVLACAVRLLDRGFFRIGTEEYAVTNESFGLATMRKEHVTARGRATSMVFDYPAKSGIAPRAGDRRPAGDRRRRAAQAPPRRRRRAARLQGGRRWRDLRSGDINEYLKEVTGADYSAKDFRTWNATVLAATALAVSGEVGGHARPAASAPSRARSRRSPTTSATRRRSAAPPTSTRACSTPTRAGSDRQGARRSAADVRRASSRSTTARSRRRCST